MLDLLQVQGQLSCTVGCISRETPRRSNQQAVAFWLTEEIKQDQYGNQFPFISSCCMSPKPMSVTLLLYGHIKSSFWLGSVYGMWQSKDL